MMELKRRIDLYKLMKKDLVGAEIGVAEGLFSRDILTGWPMKTLYSVDNWGQIDGQLGDGGADQDWHDANYKSAKALLKPFGAKSKILRGMSKDMANKVKGKLDFIYLDGDHSYKGVMGDLKAWYPKVKKGGIVAGHDYLCEDYKVSEAVADFVHENCPDVVVNITPENNYRDAGFWFKKP